MNYYDIHTHVSNSDLNALRDAINQTEKMPGLQDVYNFGNLVDSSALEKHRITGNTLSIESGGDVEFSELQIIKARDMAEAYHSNPTLSLIFQGAKPQYCYFRNRFECTYNGFTFYIAAKCKLDLCRPRIIGGDLKSTACTSEQAFKDSISHFNYDQQIAWYMDLAKLDRFMVIGLGKNKKRGKHPCFTFAVNRGDETYNSGLAKYSKLAFKHHILIGGFAPYL